MRISGERQRLTGEENIVPMINVVFLLLIFFLLAGTLSPRPPFALDPVSTTLQPPADPPKDGLYVSAGGDMYFRGAPVSLAALPGAAGAAARDASGVIEVVVDRRLKGETLFPVMEALGKAGLTKVRLITERSAGG